MLLGCSIDVRTPGSTGHAGGSSIRIYDYGTHGRQIDYESAIARRVPGKAVSPASHGEQQLTFTSKSDGAPHICSVRATRDQRRVLVNHSVPDVARRLILLLPGSKQRSLKTRAQVPDSRALNHRLCTRELYGAQI